MISCFRYTITVTNTDMVKKKKNKKLTLLMEKLISDKVICMRISNGGVSCGSL